MLKDIELPDFGEPSVEPRLGRAIYPERIDRALERVEEAGYDVLLVYADRVMTAQAGCLEIQ